ncbi:DUF4232 domain-containing protein [Brevundimonas sp.]|uniref:DUF4232 domain-containing protein n=1 Tax=Brevundimonas sp. TaxID=1871086 RepID=UPI0035AFC7DA
MRRVLAGLMILALAGCEREAPAPAPPPPEPTPGPTPTGGAPVSYSCEGGQTVIARYPDANTAVVTWEGRDATLTIAPSASGARYVGGGLEWWTASRDGQETGMLGRSTGPEPSDDPIARCSRPADAVAAPAPITLPAGSAPACAASNLRLTRAGGDAGAGNRVLVLGLRNAGPAACAVIGYPGVRLLDAEGEAITTVRSENTPSNYFRAEDQPAVVTLAPSGEGSEAFFDIASTAIPAEYLGETECPEAARIEVRLGGAAAALTLASPLTPCGRRIRVSPFRAVAEPEASPDPASSETAA